MLTRDFTRSRNRSQEFVAVVIARENLSRQFPQMLISCGKQVPSLSLSFSGFGNHAGTGASCFPLAPRARPLRNCRPLELTSIRQRGIVADWADWGKRKVCEGIHRGAHLIHSFSTSTILVQLCQLTRISSGFLTKFSGVHTSIHKFSANSPEDNSLIVEIFYRGVRTHRCQVGH